MTKTVFPIPADIDLIIFDLGGVILNIDYALTQKAFKKLGVKNVEELYSQAAQSSLFDRLEIGAISPSEFRDGLREWIGSGLSDQEVDDAWNALIQDLPAHRLEFILELKKRYQTALLSNTNEIHVTCFEESIAQTVGLETFKSCFDLLCYSSRIHQRKPHTAAWQHVLDKMNVRPERALFIDDSVQHVEAAKLMGLHAVLLSPQTEIASLLRPLLD